MDLSDKNLEAITEKVEKDYNETASGAKISVLDPDFLLMLTLVAIPFDLVLAILAILDPLFGISWVIGIVVSLFPLAIIGVWDYIRSSNTARIESDAKTKYDNIMVKIEKIKAEKKAMEFKKGLKLTKSKTKFPKQQLIKKSTTQAGKEAGKQVGKQTVKATARRAFLGGFFKRSIIAFVGTNVPLFIGMIPWYTIWVVSTAKNK